MSAPYACEDCARPMYDKRNPQICGMCSDNREREMKKKYGKKSA